MSTKRSYLSKVVVEMPDSGIKDFFDIANTMDGALSLGVGEPDFQTPGACQGGGGRFHPARRDKVYRQPRYRGAACGGSGVSGKVRSAL